MEVKPEEARISAMLLDSTLFPAKFAVMKPSANKPCATPRRPMINFRLLLQRAWIAVVCVFLASLSSAAYAADDTAPATNAIPSAGASRLVIVKAVYGDLPNGASVDVTTQVEAMVKSNSLAV